MKQEIKMKEGYYNLYNDNEPSPVVVYGYYCSDMDGQFVFGFNTCDGGGILPLKDLAEGSAVWPIVWREDAKPAKLPNRDKKVIPYGENMIMHSSECVQTKGKIEFWHVDGDVEVSEFHFFDTESKVAIGKKDLFTFIKLLDLPFTNDSKIDTLYNKIVMENSVDDVLDRIQELKSDYVSDWEDEFDSLDEAYDEQGRGAAESDVLNDLTRPWDPSLSLDDHDIVFQKLKEYYGVETH